MLAVPDLGSESGKVYDDEDPPPTAQTGDTVHFGNAKCLKPVERHVEN